MREQAISRFTVYASRITHRALRITQYAIRNTQYALLLFLLALLPRLPGLGRFLTSDENTNIFFAGSDVIAAFIRGDLAGTYWHFYPGVTMSWLDALGMGGQYLGERLLGRALPPFSDYIYGDILSLLVANRLPYALLTAAAVAWLYLLARRLLPEPVAFLGSLFLAFDPFFLAHSRVAHGDAPVAVFMALSALSLFIYAERLLALPAAASPALLRHPARIYLLISAACGGLAALTKAPGQFMALFTIGLAGLYALRAWQRGEAFKDIARNWLGLVVVWGLVSLAIFILLWPAMWVDPLGTFGRMWTETFGKVNEGHLVYFFGQPTLDPGPWFYPYVIPFRMTPIALAGVLLSWLCFGPWLKEISQASEAPAWRSPPGLRLATALLWLFVISLLLFGTLSPKKQDRYLLPLFPFLDLLAAAGWLALLQLVIQAAWPQGETTRKLMALPQTFQGGKHFAVPILAAGLVAFQAIPLITYYPYYLAYFNPLLGGPARAAQTTLMGWGEGMEQAAAYLNTRPQAERLYVASTPSQTLLPYFAGTGENFYTNDIAFRADYVVLYLAQRQRLAPSPEIIRYFEAQQPEKVITIQGVAYAQIYPGPRLIRAEMPAGATPVNTGLEEILRLAGYSHRPAAGDQKPELTLYWHALAPLPADYTISVRAWTADGQLLAQQDQWPAGGLLPTGQWRQGDYVADTHSLDLSPAQAAQINRFEIVVYDALTGDTLDPPITLVPAS